MTRWFTIHEAAAALRRKETSAVGLVRQCLAQIDRHEPTVRAWVFVDRDGALAKAERCDRELAAGRDRGPLHGIPLGIKDIIDVADWPTAAGSKRWVNSIAREDATIVRNLREAGAVFLGKTVTTAFASFDPPPTRNPWNLERTPGGSSSGSAAALATGMCLGALGSQTGGSITRPASYCGVLGMKPTYDTVPADGIVPLAHSMDHPGPMARCLHDLRLLWNKISYLGLSDLTESGDFGTIVWARGFFDRHADPTVRAMMATTVERLRDAKMEVVETELPALFDDVVYCHRIVMAVEAATWHRERFARHPDDYPPRIRGLIEEGLACPAPEYARCKKHQEELHEAMIGLLAADRILLSPATPGAAPPAETTGNPIFNSPWSYVGFPSVSMPVAWEEGLPLAIQLVTMEYRDRYLLGVAEKVERILGNHVRLPD